MQTTDKKPTFTSTEQTRFYNRDGWTGSTKVKIDGHAWLITTLKLRSGKVATHAHIVQDEGNGSYSFMMFEQRPPNEDFWLNETPTPPARVTEKVIREIHMKSLADMDAKREAGELPVKKEEDTPQIGQVLYSDHPQTGDSRRRAVYEIDGNNYKCVFLDGSDICTDNHVRHETRKFGISTYWKTGDVITQEEINDLLITAHQNREARRKAAQLKAEQDANERAAKLTIGAGILSAIPSEAVSIIIGEHKVNDSDPMTDYYGHHVDKVVYLAFSAHTRDLFPELRKAADNCPETLHLGTISTDAKQEHREKYSMGQGFYLGTHSHSGWTVEKQTLPTSEKGRADLLEKLQIAIAEGRYFVPDTILREATGEAATVGNFEVVDYSEKACAVFGDTRPIKDELKRLGGRFNPRLSHNGAKVPGWIFPKAKRPALEQLLNK